MSSADWSTFNGKQASGNYITALTGDVTASGPGSVAATLATVNSNVGSFGSATQSVAVTVNGKGLVTAASATTITPAVGNVTGLGTGVATALAVNVGTGGAVVVNGGVLGTPSSGVATNLTGTASGLTAGHVTTNANLTGDVTSVGNATTLATVNSNVGSFGSSTAIPVITLNAKGLATAASTAAVVAPAGTLSGTTLNSTIVNASLNALTPTGGTLSVTGAINTTAQVASFVTTGQAYFGYYPGVGAGIALRNSDDTSSTTFAEYQKASGTPIGSITRVTTTDAVVYNTTSDARLKKNIRHFTDSGPIIDGLRPRLFDWKSGASNAIGFIAQEENEVDPALARIGAVTVGDEDPEVITKQWQRSDAALIPILVAELKSLRARVAALESK